MNRDVAEVTAPVSPGTVLAESVLGNLDADIRLAVRRSNLAGAQERLRVINADFSRMITEVNRDFSVVQAELVRFYVRQCRPRLIECYATVNENTSMADIEAMVDNVIDQVLAGIKQQDKEPAKRPLRVRAGSK